MSQGDMIVEIEAEEVEVIIEPVPVIDVSVKHAPDVIILATGGVGIEGEKGDQGPVGPVSTTPGPPGPAGPPTPLPARLSDPPGMAANLDACDVTGWYYFAPTTIGRPGDWYGMVQVYAYSGALNTTQIVYLHGSQDIFFRTKPSGASSPWIHLFDSQGNLCAGVNTPEWVTALGMQANDQGVWSQRDNPIKVAFASWVGSDANDRFEALASGQLQWGPGNTAPDTNLYRTAPGKLKMDGSLDAAALTVAGVPVGALPARLAASVSNSVISDCNLAVASGWYWAPSGTPNSPPVAAHYFLEVIAETPDNYSFQVATSWFSSERYTRRQAGGGFTAWTKIVNSDGTVPDALVPSQLSQTGFPLSGNDFNTAVYNGWYWNYPSALNAPPGGPYFGIHVVNIANNPGYATQFAYDYGDNTKVWKRILIGGVWGAWAPFGSGGGVDFIGAWGSGTTYKQGDVVRYNGNDYVAVNPSTGVAPPAAAVIPTGGASIGITLPTSPFDGQEAILVDSLITPTYSWRFKYVASITDANKWVFIGGADIFAEVVTFETVNNNAYVAMATPGPSIVIPRSGIYQVEIGAKLYNTQGDNGSPAEVAMSYDIGATAAVDADSIQLMSAWVNVPVGLNRASVSKSRQKTLGAVTLTAKYRSGTNTQTNRGAADRWMRVTPVRVS